MKKRDRSRFGSRGLAVLMSIALCLSFVMPMQYEVWGEEQANDSSSPVYAIEFYSGITDDTVAMIPVE